MHHARPPAETCPQFTPPGNLRRRERQVVTDLPL